VRVLLPEKGRERAALALPDDKHFPRRRRANRELRISHILISPVESTLANELPLSVGATLNTVPACQNPRLTIAPSCASHSPTR
jgi:hypothetical protein